MLTQKRNILLLLLVPLLLLILWLEPGIKPPVPQPLTSLHSNQVNLIAISDLSGRSMELERNKDRWVMRQPKQGAANSGRIEQLLGITQTFSHSHFPARNAKLSEFGLQPAQITLQLNGVRLLFGNNDPVYQRRYVKIGDMVHLIDDGFQHHLLAEADQFLVSEE